MSRRVLVVLALGLLLGTLATGTTAAERPDALGAPAHFLHAPHAVCDVDGDGLSDLLVERLELLSPPRTTPSVARLFMRSSADGRLLWEAGAGDRNDLSLAPGLSFDRPSVAHHPREVVFPTEDLDGDGTCDVVLATTESITPISEPFLNSASVTTFTLEVRALSGASGERLWTRTQEGTRVQGQEGLFSSATAEHYLGVPTGAILAAGGDGPLLLTKTSDVTRVEASDALELTEPVLGESLSSRDVRIVDTVRAWDARTGDVVWERQVHETETDEWTRLSFFVAAPDLNGDGVGDPVLERLLLANPSGNELRDPVFDENLYRYGKGHALHALDGLTGADLWENLLVDPGAVRPNPPVEEGFETILWTHAQTLGDVDGDGVGDLASRILVTEERLGNTLLGGFRTHVVPISGATGTVLWDARVQGWGGATLLGTDGDGTKLALTSVDVSLDAAKRGSEATQRAHVRVVDASDGTTLWGHDHALSQIGNVPAQLALDQLMDAAAPFDLDGDGLLDVLTPAQASGRADLAQALTSLGAARYEVLSASDGRALATMEAWGGLGRVLACDEDVPLVTILGGHARRLDLTRFDLTRGAMAWREPVFNDPGLRAASAAMDMSGALASCALLENGDLLITLNAHRYSHERRGEVNPVLTRMTPAGEVVWMDPVLAGEAPLQPLVETRVTTASGRSTAEEALTYGLFVAAGLGAGFLGSLLVGRLRSRRPEKVPSLAVLGLTVALLAGLAPLPGPGAEAVGLDAAPVGGPSALAPPSVADEASDAARPERGIDPPALPSGLLARPPPPRPGTNLTPEEAMPGDGVVLYSHPVRDLDGDGAGDVVVQATCVDWRICDPYEGLEDDVQWLTTLATEGAYCGPKQRLWGVSTDTGEILWEIDTQLRRQVWGTVSCRLHVVGVVDLGDGRDGILLYERTERYADLGISSRVLENSLGLVDAATGELLWIVEEPGVYGNGLAAWRFARNWDLRFEIAPGPPGEGDLLFVRGRGYEMHVAEVFFVQFLGLRRDPTVADVWEPVEWVARLDPATGTELWRNDAFLPGGTRSVYVWSHWMEPGSWYWSTWNDPVPPIIDEANWLPGCCGDLTGDGVADPVLHTREWPFYPEINAQGPYFLDATLHVFDGASGERLYAVPIAQDVDPQAVPPRGFGLAADAFITSAQAAGDLTGDGAGDLLVHQERLGGAYERVTSAHDGLTGALLWERAGPEDAAFVRLGDVDGDSGMDLLALAWHGPVAGDEVGPPAAIPRGHRLEVLDGDTGAVLRSMPAWGAAVDLLVQFDWLDRLGAPDLDADGVGDLVLDDPFALDDQTIVHRLEATSGATGASLWQSTAVGAFALTGSAGDLTDDGRDDILVLSGDQSDLWLTLHDGAGGAALWSTRALALEASGLARALPRLQVDPLEAPDGRAPRILIGFQMQADVLSSFLALSWDEATNTYTFGYVEEPEPFVVNNIAVLSAGTGEIALRYGSGLSMPGTDRSVPGATPATQALETLRDDASEPLVVQAAEAARSSLPEIGLVVLGLLLGVLLQVGLARLASRDEGVPDLDL